MALDVLVTKKNANLPFDCIIGSCTDAKPKEAAGENVSGTTLDVERRGRQTG